MARLAGPIARVKYSPWDKARSSKWRSEMRHFDRAVAAVEARTQTFIGDAFAALRSAEGAFDVLSEDEFALARAMAAHRAAGGLVVAAVHGDIGLADAAEVRIG